MNTKYIIEKILPLLIIIAGLLLTFYFINKVDKEETVKEEIESECSENDEERISPSKANSSNINEVLNNSDLDSQQDFEGDSLLYSENISAEVLDDENHKGDLHLKVEDLYPMTKESPTLTKSSEKDLDNIQSLELEKKSKSKNKSTHLTPKEYRNKKLIAKLTKPKKRKGSRK